MKAIVGFIEEATGKAAVVKRQPETDSFSIFGKRRTATLSTARARGFGFHFQQTRDWLLPLVRSAAN